MDYQTKHYTLSPEPGTHTAQLKETYDINGLITGADISDDSQIVLLGYNELGFIFMWILFDFEQSDFFSGNKRRIELGTALTNSQTEGIAFRENGYGYICSEKFTVNNQIILPPKLLSFSIKQWTDFTNPVENVKWQKHFKVYPNPSKNFIKVESIYKSKLQWNLYSSTGYLIKKGILEDDKTKIDTSNLKSGNYFFVLFDNEKRTTIPIAVK